MVQLLGDVYPELREGRSLIQKVVDDEETRFRATLNRGLKLIETFGDWKVVDGQKVMPGAAA